MLLPLPPFTNGLRPDLPKGEKCRMASPAGLEPAAFCLQATQYKALSAASGVAYEGARHLSRP